MYLEWMFPYLSSVQEKVLFTILEPKKVELVQCTEWTGIATGLWSPCCCFCIACAPFSTLNQ